MWFSWNCMYHFDLVSKYFSRDSIFSCNTPVLFSMIFVARFLGFLQEYFFRLYLFPFFHHCIFPIVFLHGFISMFFPIFFLDHVSLFFLFQELYFFSCTIPRCFFPECFFQYWFFNVYFSRVVFCHFFPAHDYKFFQYVFSRKRVFPVRYIFSRAVFYQLFPAPCFFQDVFSRIAFFHFFCAPCAYQFFPECFFQNCILLIFSCTVCLHFFPGCFSRIVFCSFFPASCAYQCFSSFFSRIAFCWFFPAPYAYISFQDVFSRIVFCSFFLHLVLISVFPKCFFPRIVFCQFFLHRLISGFFHYVVPKILFFSRRFFQECWILLFFQRSNILTIFHLHSSIFPWIHYVCKCFCHVFFGTWILHICFFQPDFFFHRSCPNAVFPLHSPICFFVATDHFVSNWQGN